MLATYRASFVFDVFEQSLSDTRTLHSNSANAAGAEKKGEWLVGNTCTLPQGSSASVAFCRSTVLALSSEQPMKLRGTAPNRPSVSVIGVTRGALACGRNRERA